MIILLSSFGYTFSGLATISLVGLDTYTFVIETSWGEDDEEFSSWNVAVEAYLDELAYLEYNVDVWKRAQVDKLEAKLSLEVDEYFMFRQLEQALVKSELILVKAWDMWESQPFEQVELWCYGEYQILAQYTGDVQVFEVFLNSVKIDHDSWDCCSGWYPTLQEWVLDWVKINR
jgi:hypothetical protein